jgi:circadian clock protein KaiC
VLTDLKHSERPQQSSMISSLVDTWIVLEDVEANGESNRILKIVKSRGMAHSNRIREFYITSKGIDLIPPYVGPSGVLTGSARYAQEAREKAEEVARAEEIEQLQQNLEQQRKALNAQIEALQAEFESNRADLERRVKEEERRKEDLERNRKHMRAVRAGDRESR